MKKQNFNILMMVAFFVLSLVSFSGLLYIVGVIEYKSIWGSEKDVEND